MTKKARIEQLTFERDHLAKALAHIQKRLTIAQRKLTLAINRKK